MKVTKWVIVGLWLVVLGALMPLAAELTSVEKNDSAAWLPRSAEATVAYERATAHFPGSDSLVAVVVYARDGGLTDADRAEVNRDHDAATAYARGGQVSPVVLSTDGAAALYSLPIAGDPNDEQAQTAAIDGLKQLMRDGAPPGLQTAFTGPAGMIDDLLDSFAGMDGTIVLVTVAVVALILLITYRSPALWLVPLVTVGLASQLASAIVYLLAKHAGLTVNGQSASILTVLVFGAGTDYALLLIARYREELRRHADRHQAMWIAWRASAPAILASGITVAVGLLCLLAADMNSTRGLGPVGAIGIATALLAMMTLLPALLVIFGRWLFWPFVPRYSATVSQDISADHGIWGRLARGIGRRPRLIWIGTALALGALALGTLTLRTGMTQEDLYTKEVGSVTGQHLLEKHFPSGASAPATILARPASADAVVAAARGVPGVSFVDTPRVAPDGSWVSIDAVLTPAPDTVDAEAVVRSLRAAVDAVPGADAVVGGSTAIGLDTHTATDRDNRTVVPLILAVVLLVLILLLRSLVAPLLLLASVVLSFASAMGAAALIYTALGHNRIDPGFALFCFLFLVALGVDYTIFLMTRAREETARTNSREGIMRALTVTGGVITSAGVVLAATFAVLTVFPLVTMLQMGIAVAAGVLLDTLVVRSLLVPALAVDTGKRIWWPSRLSRQAGRSTSPGSGAEAGIRPTVGSSVH
jgi:RND superfamily putative drug exporter